MFNYPYIIELLSPKKTDDAAVDGQIERFAGRYRRIVESGCGLSIPDNPMGQRRMGALESIEMGGLAFESEKVVMNLNTFHTKSELDGLLKKAISVKLKYILVVRGDGGPSLPKLDPKSIGGQYSVSTSIDLIRYLNNEYEGQFITGAAFNPYKPMPFEHERLKQKISAGAKFVVTQPILGEDENVSMLGEHGIPVVVEAWMSRNIELLYKSIGKEIGEETTTFDPVDSLKTLHSAYPKSCVYLSMLGFKMDWREMLPRLSKG